MKRVYTLGFEYQYLAAALALLAAMVAIACAAGVQLSGLSAEQAFAVEATSTSRAELAAESAATTKVQSEAKPSKKQRKAFKSASADFSIDLFKRCVAAEGANSNVTVAPMSVLTALAMTANGASGKTATQMLNVLADGASAKVLRENLRWYNSKLKNVKKAHISSANAIWYDNSASLVMKKRFLKANKKYLGAEVRPADFTNQATTDSINAWVAAKTNDMIKQLIGRLDPDSRIVLVNALYFDAEWLSPYDKSDVNARPFTTGSGDKHTVDMMFSSEHRYIEGNGATGFIRPYAKGYSYVALLPEKGTSLKQFVSKLDGAAFRKLVTKTTTPLVRAGLPKYTIEYSNEDMGTQLAAMGMPRAFDSARANFKKMGTDPTGNLYIGAVVHKTKIELDELGTKAAAATGVVAKAASAPIDVKIVILDRPFVYAIIDNATKLPVFIGTINDIG